MDDMALGRRSILGSRFDGCKIRGLRIVILSPSDRYAIYPRALGNQTLRLFEYLILIIARGILANDNALPEYP